MTTEEKIATGHRLDDLAILHEVPRFDGETDASLRERMMHQQNPNNIIPKRPFLAPSQPIPLWIAALPHLRFAWGRRQ